MILNVDIIVLAVNEKGGFRVIKCSHSKRIQLQGHFVNVSQKDRLCYEKFLHVINLCHVQGNCT